MFDGFKEVLIQHEQRYSEAEGEISRLTQLLSQERDDFGKKETELMKTIADLKTRNKILEKSKTTKAELDDVWELFYDLEKELKKVRAERNDLEARNKKYREALEKIKNASWVEESVAEIAKDALGDGDNGNEND
jgi:chromosome segregation ATPase